MIFFALESVEFDDYSEAKKSLKKVLMISLILFFKMSEKKSINEIINTFFSECLKKVLMISLILFFSDILKKKY